MKKVLVCLGILAFAVQSFALRPGDNAADLGKITWIRGSGFDCAGKVQSKSAVKPLRMVVFMLCRASGSDTTVRMLDALLKKYPELKIAILTPDPVLDARELLKDFPAAGADFGIDVERKTTPQYMAGSLLFPMAFLIDESGTVVWCGEAIDAPEAVENFYTRGLDSDVERRIAVAMDQLQMLLRGGSEREMNRCVEEVLSLEPGHPGALRIRVFVLEQNGRFQEALALLMREIKKSPKLTRLYVSAFDLISRHRELDDKLPSLLDSFEKSVTLPEHLNAMAWALLNSFDFDIAALEYAQKFCTRASTQLKDSLPLEMTAALLAYRLGDLDQAILHQEKACAILENSADKSGISECRERAEFFRRAKKLSQKNK